MTAPLLRLAIERLQPERALAISHGATVVTQHDDDTLDLDVDVEDGASPWFVNRVPLRVGIPTARVLVEEGTRVRLAFEDGDQRKPYAFGIDGDPDADKGLARVGDIVDIGILSYAGPGALTWTHPDPLHVPPQQVGTIQLQGIIVSGSERVKLRGDE